MSGAAKRILKFIAGLLLLFVLVFATLVAYLSATEYKPDDISDVGTFGDASRHVSRGDSISIISWNTGYGALGDNADFFMDGGSKVFTADSERVLSNLAGIESTISDINPDIMMLQEVDEDSARSRHINEIDYYRDKYTDYESSFAYNYNVSFVPFPLPPLGKVTSGIMTLSKFPMSSAERYQLPIPFSWPVRTANLKRCLLVTRIPIDGSSNELVIINLHLEAYDSGEGKIAQTKMLSEILEEEQNKGNYVIAGGDFNQIFSSERENLFPVKKGMWTPGLINISQISGSWSFLMDEKVPSCRSLDQVYADADKEDFQYYLIDGFIVSLNISIDEFANQNTGFVYSDHNPVLLKITLR